jgi:hypothetical protein
MVAEIRTGDPMDEAFADCCWGLGIACSIKMGNIDSAMELGVLYKGLARDASAQCWNVVGVLSFFLFA